MVLVRHGNLWKESFVALYLTYFKSGDLYIGLHMYSHVCVQKQGWIDSKLSELHEMVFTREEHTS